MPRDLMVGDLITNSFAHTFGYLLSGVN